MIDKRYQVFISTSGSDVSDACRILCQTLVGMGCFAWGVGQRSVMTSTLARRQIDDSDYVILLLGADYGDLSSSGMSYMQLEYIYALARQKTVIVFVLAQPKRSSVYAKMSQDIKVKFNSFRQQMLEDVKSVFEFESGADLELKTRVHLPDVFAAYPGQGWTRSYGTRLLQDEIQRLKQRVLQLEKSSGQQQSSPHAMLTIEPVQCSDVFDLEYQLHAYSNENRYYLKQVKKITWLNILQILAHSFIQPKPEIHFLYSINRYLEKVAMFDIAVSHSHLTEISSVNVSKKSLQSIKVQMQKNTWIVPVGRNNYRHVLWQMMPVVANKLNKVAKNNELNLLN